jgi:hypothetical protein
MKDTVFFRLCASYSTAPKFLFFLNFVSRYPDDSKTALYFATEREGANSIRTKTFGQLRASVARFAAGKV